MLSRVKTFSGSVLNIGGLSHHARRVFVCYFKMYYGHKHQAERLYSAREYSKLVTQVYMECKYDKFDINSNKG